MKRSLAALTIVVALVIGSASAAFAYIAYNWDNCCNTKTLRGAPTLKQKKQVDLRKVSAWRSGSYAYVRWEVEDLVSDIGFPQLTLGDPGVANWPGSKKFTVWNGSRWVCPVYPYALSYASNYVTVRFPKSCVPRGRSWEFNMSSWYLNGAKTVEVQNWSHYDSVSHWTPNP